MTYTTRPSHDYDKIFLFVGLVLTTLAVDIMGSTCIERIHSWGRGLDAMGFIRALKGVKAGMPRPSRAGLRSYPRTRQPSLTLMTPMRVCLLARPSPLRVLLRPVNDPSTAFSGPLEPIGPFLDALDILGPEISLVCSGPDSIRQLIIPQAIREEVQIPNVLLNYFDLSRLFSEPLSEDFEKECEEIELRLQNVTEEELSNTLETVSLEVETASIRSSRDLKTYSNFFCRCFLNLYKKSYNTKYDVVKRSGEPSLPSACRRDCVRLRGLPYEARVEHVVEFLGEHARNIQFQGVHMVFNSQDKNIQGHPSGEAFIQMNNEQAAAAAATGAHNKFMIIGKKQRYIEVCGFFLYLFLFLFVMVFQCSPDDMHLVMAPPTAPPAVPPPPLILPQRPAFVPNIPTMVPMSAPMFWPYPSPPVSPNMILPGQMNQLVVYGIGPNVGLPDLIAHFQTPDVVVENVMFTRVAQGNIPGEAVVTIRTRTPSDPPVVPIDPQFLAKVPIDPQFVSGAVPISIPQTLPHQPIYTLIQS
uniref:RRM domain-containing protein n=1 Tax=Heterorhabditis bacteriophora TaxID=37862 RepID=A0A1I7WSB2_HETBA